MKLIKNSVWKLEPNVFTWINNGTAQLWEMNQRESKAKGKKNYEQQQSNTSLLQTLAAIEI